jgi:hypothetical protein
VTRGGISSAPAFGFGPSGHSAPIAAAARRTAVESWTVTEGDIDAWLKTARIGETFVYCHGPQLVQGAAAARVRALADAGEVIPHNKRAGDGGLDFFVRRNRVRVVTQRAPVCDPQMMAVLLVIQDAAQDGRQCPTDVDIAADTDLHVEQVKWALRKLVDAKFIERRTVAVPGKGTARFRIVKVIATGMETAGPQ